MLLAKEPTNSEEERVDRLDKIVQEELYQRELRREHAIIMVANIKSRNQNAFFGVASLLCAPWLLASFLSNAPVWYLIFIICVSVWSVNKSTRDWERYEVKIK